MPMHAERPPRAVSVADLVSSRTFDLTECSLKSYSATRAIRIEFAVFAILLAVIPVGIVLFQLSRGTQPTSPHTLYGLPELAVFAVALYLGWGSTKFAPGATRLSITAEGVRFDFPKRSSTMFRWSDPNIRLNLVDARATPIAQKYGLEGYARIPHRPSTRLTSEALDALVVAARDHGLRISVRKRGGRWSMAGPLHEWIEIRANQSG